MYRGVTRSHMLYQLLVLTIKIQLIIFIIFLKYFSSIQTLVHLVADTTNMEDGKLESVE